MSIKTFLTAGIIFTIYSITINANTIYYCPQFLYCYSSSFEKYQCQPVGDNLPSKWNGLITNVTPQGLFSFIRVQIPGRYYQDNQGECIYFEYGSGTHKSLIMYVGHTPVQPDVTKTSNWSNGFCVSNNVRDCPMKSSEAE